MAFMYSDLPTRYVELVCCRHVLTIFYQVWCERHGIEMDPDVKWMLDNIDLILDMMLEPR